MAPWASMVIVNSGWWELKRCSATMPMVVMIRRKGIGSTGSTLLRY